MSARAAIGARRTAMFAAAAMSTVVACGSPRGDDADGARSGASSDSASSGAIVRDAWSRPAGAGATGVAYMTLENADTLDLHLVRVSSPVAKGAQIHESATMANVTSMSPRPDVSIVRGATVSMRPGGLHIMLVDLARALVLGDTVPLTLEFSNGRRLSAAAIVRDTP